MENTLNQIVSKAQALTKTDAKARARIAETPTGTVSLSYTDDLGNRHISEFFASGRYVYEIEADQNRQVCDRLSRFGCTLMCNDKSDLLGLIRREWRALQRAERRAAKRGA